jgi:hypothetical protein
MIHSSRLRFSSYTHSLSILSYPLSYSFLHSLHALFMLFLTVFVVLSSTSKYLLQILLSPCLLSFIVPLPINLYLLPLSVSPLTPALSKSFNCILSLLLNSVSLNFSSSLLSSLIAGDIENSRLILVLPLLPLLTCHFNIRSATTVTPIIDKPSTLHEFISGYKFDPF